MSLAQETAELTPPPLGRNRDFVLWFSGSMISTLGSCISGFAWPLLVLAATGSAAKAAFIGSCSSLTYVLCSLPSGVLADRYPRRPILVGTALTQLAALAAVTVFVLTGGFSLPLLTGAAMLESAMGCLRSA